MSKIHHLIYRCEKNFEASDTELEKKTESSEIFFFIVFFFLFWIISFPNQVMNTEILWKYYNKIIAVDQAPPQKA